MRKLVILLTLIGSMTGYSFAQDTVRVKVVGKDVVTVIEDHDHTNVQVGGSMDVTDMDGDTVKIRLGRKTVIISEDGNVVFDVLDDEKYEKWTGKKPKFKGHWALFEMGVNSFGNVSYAGYEVGNWMDINHNKSFEVNINLLRYSIGLQKHRNTIGLVTGLGLNLNDYRFSEPYTIENREGRVEPVLLQYDNLSKTKLSTTYLHVPLLAEFQIPVKGSHKRIYMSGGVIGGIRIGSHTKVKHGNTKDKDRSDFNIAPFRYGATARIGYKGINLFGTYYFSEFFRDGRGPVMNPFTIGIGIIN